MMSTSGIAYFVLPVLLLAASAMSQGPPPGIFSTPGFLQPGFCSIQWPVMDFDVEKYVGRWYEVERNPNVFEFGRCGTATYDLEPDGSLRVNNTEILESGASSTSLGKAEFVGTFNEAKLNVAFDNSPAPPSTEGNYFVLATDYANYAVVWSCTPVPAEMPSKIELLWILGRHQVLDPYFLIELKHWLVHRGVDVTRLIPGLQAHCPP
ncbi:apolipoprotein D-like [Oratosquilla oratoria]|uniref:apolipoprotein D-like n=1 Tax=Oratosquilla oratoria TaxID=337810 RepID=UPI003F760876